jgi:hypothetical protein
VISRISMHYRLAILNRSCAALLLDSRLLVMTKISCCRYRRL